MVVSPNRGPQHIMTPILGTPITGTLILGSPILILAAARLQLWSPALLRGLGPSSTHRWEFEGSIVVFLHAHRERDMYVYIYI